MIDMDLMQVLTKSHRKKVYPLANENGFNRNLIFFRKRDLQVLKLHIMKN